MLVLLAAHGLASAQPPVKRGPVVLTPEGLRIHRAGFVFDGHNDLPWELRTRADGDFEKFDVSRPQPKLHTDIPRLRQGGVGAQFWSAFVPADTAKTGESLKQSSRTGASSGVVGFLDSTSGRLLRQPEC